MKSILIGYFMICSGVGMIMGAGAAMTMHVSLPGFILGGMCLVLGGCGLIPMRLK